MTTKWKYRVHVVQTDDAPLLTFNFRYLDEATSFLFTIGFADIYEATLSEAETGKALQVKYGLLNHDQFAKDQVQYRLRRLQDAAGGTHDNLIEELDHAISHHES